MNRFSKVALQAAVFAFAAGGVAAGAHAQSAQDRPVPKSWNYGIKDGKRVPKPSNRVTRPDGSWREEIRKGDCVIVKEKTASGEYRETRHCD